LHRLRIARLFTWKRLRPDRRIVRAALREERSKTKEKKASRHRRSIAHKIDYFSGMRFLVLSFLVACGARTDLGGATSGAAPCGKSPWVLFDYGDGLGAHGIAAIRADRTEFHIAIPDAFLPAMSPDGASLLYITGDDQNESLVLLDLASHEVRTVLTTTIVPPHIGFGKAAVSYDDKWIAFGNSPDLHLVHFDGSGDHVLVQGPYEAGCCPWSYGHPQFSLDSSIIYYSTIGRLESIHTDGSAQTLLYQDQFLTNPSIPGFVFPNVSLSPDGQKLVAQVACDVSALRVFDVASLPTTDPCKTGTELVQTGLSLASNEASNAAWGPTDLVAWDDAKDILLIPSGGGQTSNLTSIYTTNANAAASDPVWR
jgi:Tol biopolymer transport system component